MTTLGQGARLGPYEIAAPIGAGGMGEVYKARDTRLDRLVAIKNLPARTAHDPQAVARFEREARAVAALSHPNILAIHDIGHDGDTVFVVMELLEGKSLRDALPLPIKKAIDIASQVAAGLAAAHAKGIIHRDLKPENIFLTADGSVKTLDFALAKFTESSDAPIDPNVTRGVANTDAGLVLGTTGYLSPEQAQGHAVDARSDIFSFGAVLYELVTGERAFAGNSTIDTLHKIVNDTPAPVASRVAAAPDELQWVIAKCLAKDPDERYQSTRDLVVDLKKVMRTVETSTSSTPVRAPSAATTSSRPKRTALMTAAAVAVLVVGGAVAWMSWRGSRAGESAARPITVERVTTLGTVIDASVSPDGKYVAYATAENGKQGIFLRQLATASTLTLVPPGPIGDWGMAFSPDGNELFYSMYTPDEPLRAIFRISTIGGTPRKVISGTDSRPIPSPDGRHLAWVRGSYPQPTDSALLVADADGSHVRVVATAHAPDVFVPIFFTQPAWSPDGKIIVVPMQHRANPAFGTFTAFDAQSGAPAAFPTHRFANVGPAVWTPDGAGLIVIATPTADAQRSAQVWWISAHDDTRRRMTNDLLDYRLVSLTADGKTMVAVGSDSTSSVWTAS